VGCVNAGTGVRLLGSGDVGVVLTSVSATLVDVAFPDGVKTVQVADLEKLPAEPIDALLTGHIGSVERWGLRVQALYLRHAYRYDELSGLSSARIEPQLHQVYVAHRVLNKLAPRMILADEVGLGKTIEAGLILKELRARQVIDRVLVVCPASLQMQWHQELRSKFNEDFTIMDGDAAKHLGKGDANPFSKTKNVICSLSFAGMPKRSEQIIDAGWDLVIFDEAHRVRRQRKGSTTTTTRTYDLADELKDLAYGLLLLTATPMQLSPFELWSHIELVEPGLYPDYSEYEYRRTSLPRLNEAMRTLQGWSAMNEPARREFVASGGGRILVGITNVNADKLVQHLNDRDVREQVMDALVDAHPLSQVLVRNRKANLEGFTRRRATSIPVQSTPHEQALYEAVTDYIRHGYNLALEKKNNAIGFLMVGYHKMLTSSPAAIASSLQKRLVKLRQQQSAIDGLTEQDMSKSKLEVLRENPELSEVLSSFENLVLDPALLGWEIEQLTGLVDELEEAEDSKAEELIRTVLDLLETHPDEKLLIFTQFIETQLYLKALLEHFEIDVQIFNGTLKLEEKEEAVRRFRERASVLISTEAGGEGRNFQFAHIMFNYDLPWNPMKVEQRIGRLDRIGQKQDVLIYNLFREGTVEERVLDVLERRIRLFEESVGMLDPILGQIESDLEDLVRRHMHDLDDAIEAWAEKDLEQRLREARELEHTLGDFVMDRASLRQERAKQLIANHGPMAKADDLASFVRDAVTHWGGTCVPRDEGDVVLTIPPTLAKKINSKKDTHLGVFDPEAALRLEDRDFYAFGHPLVDGLVQLPLDDAPVVACIQERPDVPEGLWVEFVYEITTRGLRNSGRLLRHLVNKQGDVVADDLAALPAIGSGRADLDVPSWTDEAFRASQQAAHRALEHERQEAETKDEVVRRERLSRAERVYQHSHEQLETRIARLQDQIAELHAAGSKRQQRVIPALEGQISANENRIRTLQANYEHEIDTLKSQRSDSTLQVLAASVVTAS
jgi:superfamily II DNA or RNA helicase